MMNTSLGLASSAAPDSSDLAIARAAETPKVGDQAPTVAAVDQDGKAWKSADRVGKKVILLYFYPKDDTPGCTKQGCALRDGYAELTRRGVAVFGVSRDDVAAQAAFKAKYRLPFTLLADTEGAVVAAFGVPSYPLVGTPRRQAYLVRGVAQRGLAYPSGEEDGLKEALKNFEAAAKRGGFGAAEASFHAGTVFGRLGALDAAETSLRQSLFQRDRFSARDALVRVLCAAGKEAAAQEEQIGRASCRERV